MARSGNRRLGWLATAALQGLVSTAAANDVPVTAGSARSADGAEIRYAVSGAGQPALVFVHGWSCDRSYWQGQLPYFAARHRVLAVDLAGHGESGSDRERYTMARFGEDVVAAVDAAGLEGPIVLVGHSMGGPVILEAAVRLGERVAGVVAVDSLRSVGAARRVEPAELEARLAAMAADFRGESRPFIEAMFVDGADPALRETVVEDMLAADPRVAVSAIRGLNDMDYAATLAALEAPLVLINSDYQPTVLDGLRELHPDTRLELMSGVGHFLMMEDPVRFNAALEQTISSLIPGAVPAAEPAP
jgi:pimeloyl-ACP methyl ester carboxylesterase